MARDKHASESSGDERPRVICVTLTGKLDISRAALFSLASGLQFSSMRLVYEPANFALRSLVNGLTTMSET